MTNPAVNLSATAKTTVASRIVWCSAGVVGPFAAAFILYLRFARISAVYDGFGGNAFDLLPMTGTVSGVDPHFFFRLMHNLTHPILSVGYAVILACLAIRFLTKPPVARLSKFLFEATAVMILALLDAYLACFFLPVGDLITTNIKP